MKGLTNGWVLQLWTKGQENPQIIPRFVELLLASICSLITPPKGLLSSPPEILVPIAFGDE